MTQHSSLKGGQKGAGFRSVLKRYEKIKELSEKEKWDEEKDSIYRLPKVKRIKFKVKKVKAEGEKTGEEGAAVEGAVAAPGASKGAAAGGASSSAKDVSGGQDKKGKK